MAYTAIDDAGANYSTVLYTGTSSSNAITGVGFAPNLVWLKDRDQTYYPTFFDTVRGVTKLLYSNSTDDEATDVNSLTAFGADGFTVGSNNNENYSGDDFVSWNWKGGTTTGIDTTGSTITPTGYSFNQDAGFSVIAYTGNDTAGALVSHGLGAVPEVIFVKLISTGAEGWQCYFKLLGNTKYMVLNTTASVATSTLRWNDTTPTSVNFSLGTETSVNGNTYGYVAYCFAPKQGYSAFGTYESNGNADGTFVYTGFRPAYILCKSFDGTGDWYQFDNKRLGYNVDNNSLTPNTTAAEGTSDKMDILSNGWKWRTSGTLNNASTCIWMAFAESPFVNSNGVPTNAR